MAAELGPVVYTIEYKDLQQLLHGISMAAELGPRAPFFWARNVCLSLDFSLWLLWTPEKGGS